MRGILYFVAGLLLTVACQSESLDAVLRHGFDGAVLSWNIMQAPDSHISCLGKR